ncbi:MAG: amidohydrolase family protein [bacterium]|nr:amidohydrolase family protein [bacterium]
MKLARQFLAGLALATLWIASVSPAPGETLGDPSAWRNDLPEQPEATVVRNATIWTSGPDGRLENADLLIRGGRVSAVGVGLSAPAGAIEIGADGKHVTPGLIDAHSHVAITGGVNEGTNITTAEVRIQDVIDAHAVDLYRQLAGGLTTANLMHGSANSIGGQTATIKLRWGQPPEELLLDGAYRGIKFALGENPKQSNWNVQERRYPQTRAGVEQSIRERFTAALDYRREWNEHRASPDRRRVPPRRDLQLEALIEVLEGKRGIQSHSYRADEIIMLMRIAEDFGFHVKCYQHVLEGYKVADEIAAHGAGASTFSDWWAYKYEVIDAIPYNGAIMWDRNVVVSFNSDSSELARRMNLEAAKAVRYGGVPEEEALKFVTLNPAIQLGIEDRVGSLETGKDADFVIWSGDPLSSYSIVEQTWVDGRKYFDRAEDLARREAVAAERSALLARARSFKEKPEDEEATGPDDEGEIPAETPPRTPTTPVAWPHEKMER